MKMNTEEFVLPSLHEALQTNDEVKLDIATDAWEQASIDYQNYLSEVDWPEWLHDFIFGEPGTGINSSEKLHDAEVKEFWSDGKKLIMVLSTKDCAWDARKAVVVVEYKLASVPVVLDGKMFDNSGREFMYDQFFDLGSGVYRHYIMFNNMNVQIDFNYLKFTRFEMSN